MDQIKDNIKSIYIHIPFCSNICSYCDFCKLYYNEKFINNYLEALNKEIDKYYQKEKIKTLYLGGGTPSCLKIKQLIKLFNILKKIKLAKNYEFTFECNIEDINDSLLKLLKENRVNRLSIGIESFNKKILNNIGRKQIPDKKKIILAKKYFDNINIDLIYGTNNQTLADLENDLEEFLNLDVPHISIYSLILEDNTILKINNYKEQNDELVRDMYDKIKKILKQNNYIHYEISNFAKKGYESKHNLTYWNNYEYYGFGLGASGFVNNIRYENTKSLNNYLNGNYRLNQTEQTPKENMENEMILGLRKIKGVSKKVFFNKYNKEIESVFNIEKLAQNKNYYYIREKDLFISNSILIDFIDIE